MSEIYEDKIMESLNFGIPIYRKINYMKADNLNPYIIGELSIRVPIKVTGDTEFYEKPIVFDRKKVETLVKNKSKFSLDNNEVRKSIYYECDDLYKKIIINMVKMNFWK